MASPPLPSSDELLPSVNEEHKKELDFKLTCEEVTAAVQRFSSGRDPGIDGLPSEFYKAFWGVIGGDFVEILEEIHSAIKLPVSCQCAAIFYTKKGTYVHLKTGDH